MAEYGEEMIRFLPNEYAKVPAPHPATVAPYSAPILPTIPTTGQIRLLCKPSGRQYTPWMHRKGGSTDRSGLGFNMARPGQNRYIPCRAA